MPPPRVSCCPDTKYEFSASYSFYLNLSENLWTRRTAHRRAMSCHLLDCHGILIQNMNFQPTTPSISQNSPAPKIFGKLLDQENRSLPGDNVPLLRGTCSPDTKYEYSVTHSFSFSTYPNFKIFRKIFVSEGLLIQKFFDKFSSWNIS